MALVPYRNISVERNRLQPNHHYEVSVNNYAAFAPIANGADVAYIMGRKLDIFNNGNQCVLNDLVITET